MSSWASNYFSNIKDMENAVKKGGGFDFVIIVSSDKKQAEFWQKRLNRFKGKIVGENTKIISQYEDWKGEGAGPARTKSPKATAVSPLAKRTSNGAGQLLGTLYAFHKANKNNILGKALKDGKTVAIYHTAGKGKRLAPLTFSEGGNKPAIKLPKLLAKGELFTILDAVIFQTQAFAKSRPGRLCVFWGDQIIIPSEKFNFEGKIPGRGEIEAEIFGIQKEIPKKITIWQKEWQHYGILARDRTMRFFQREKISWQDFLVFKKTMRIERLSKSLGFFSISRQFLKALMEEFKGELKKRTGKLDTDFHLWTSLTCSKKEYVQKKGDAAHWERIRKFKEKFLKKESKDCLLIRAKNLGDDTLWWDFGQLIFYYENLLKLLENSLEGEVMRKFFSVKKTNNFISIGSKLKGRIRNSVVVNSRAKDLNIEGAIIINSNVKKLIAKKVLLYNLKNLKDETLNVGEVVCGVRLKNKKPTILKTNLDRDGKKDWENKILNNPYSYQQLEKLL